MYIVEASGLRFKKNADAWGLQHWVGGSGLGFECEADDGGGPFFFFSSTVGGR